MLLVMEAQNIHTGVDPHRVQLNKPAFFINWQFGNQNYYFFTAIRSQIETVKRGLEKNPEVYTCFYGMQKTKQQGR